MHNIESELARTHAMAAGGLAGWLSARFAGMYRRLEREWLPVFDTVLVTSADDRTRLRHPDLRVFPNAIPDVPRLAVREENVIAFSGNLEYHPNTEAVRWFAREVWPLIHVRLPEAEWRLIGRNPEAIREFIEHSPATNVAGPVEDAIAALAEARVCVVPLLSGSGTRFKILEAWAAERAVVSTTIGAEGLGARDGQHLLIADDRKTFAEAVLRVAKDPELRSRLGRAGRARYEEHFTWTAAWRAMDDAGGL